jgi:nitrous oxidase accessory protein NosD
LEITYTYDGTTYKSYLGNYWNDYKGTDAEGDGIGDTHYSIYSVRDDYPLMTPFENYRACPIIRHEI